MISNAQDVVEHFSSALMFGTVGIGGSLNLGQKNQTDPLPKFREAGLADHVWSLEELVGLLDARKIEAAA
jgi:hypothetical protein